ncbi:MAG: Dihydroorotase [Candidatus Dichloromethanomonas elyunquensis]|nr:MAG: Dihydroorotase [Candidatus Dichloromethanomonas elyunquensis]
MLWIKNVTVIDPAQDLSGLRDVLVQEGKISAIGENFQVRDVQTILGIEQIEKVKQIEGTGKYLFPGLIDVHVHLREPGQENKEDIRSGSRAAVRGGFTSILAMANTAPVIDQRALAEFVRLQGQRAGMARVYPVAAVTKGFKGQELVEMMDIRAGGAVGFSDDGKGIQNAEMMRLALEYAKMTGCPIISHCEDSDLAGSGSMRRGEVSARLGLRGIPASAESVMVARDVLLAGETGGKIHIAHVSTKQSVEIIRTAKAMGIDVTCEVNPHHLLFTDQDVTLTGTSLKVNPPLPSEEDQDALLQGLADGTIDMLATDHAPHTWEEKAKPFAEAPFGINALETVLAAVWQNLATGGKLTSEQVVKLWSVNPARRFGLAGGTLQTGAAADMVLFDSEYRETVTADSLESKAQNTPFLGKELKGFPIMTWVGGRLVMENRKIIPQK